MYCGGAAVATALALAVAHHRAVGWVPGSALALVPERVSVELWVESPNQCLRYCNRHWLR